MNNLKSMIKIFSIISIFVLGAITAAGIYSDSDPIPQVEGLKGDNNWYISDVYVSFSYDPTRVDAILYNLNGNWIEYNGNPFILSDDGLYNIDWYWVDELGENHTGLPITLKIDQTPPTIELSKQSGVGNKVTFTADAEDSSSDIAKVEFYLDDVLQETITGDTFEWIWEGEGEHWVYAIAYNNAGHFTESDPLSTPRSHSKNFNLINIFFEKILEILVIFFNI
jgi:hypothetical protein